MDNYHIALGHLLSQFQERSSLYTVLILVFCYHFLFEKNLPCTCENLPRDCSLYMILPTFIILFALLWMDKLCQRGCRGRGRGCCRCSCFVICRSFNAVFISLIWPVSVLIDGDWSVCCFDHSHHNISCFNESQRSEDDKKELREIKDVSRITGLLVFLVLLVCAFIASLVQNGTKKSQRGNWHEIVLEEEEKLVPDKLREKARKELRNKLETYVKNHDWAECLVVGDEVIAEMDSPPPESRTPPQATAESQAGTPHTQEDTISVYGTPPSETTLLLRHLPRNH